MCCSKVNILFIFATQAIDFGICYIFFSIKAMIVVEPAANKVFEVYVSILMSLSFLDGRRSQEKGEKLNNNKRAMNQNHFIKLPTFY